MGHARKGYCRDGDYVEVRLPKTVTVATLAMEVLQVEEDEEEEKGEAEPSIFRIDGTVVFH